ncbi:MAG: tRNA pseudouridine(38-40) synthase TruA [Halobacteriota archaeon]
MTRLAFKFGFLGTNYHGFQIQPQSELPTIEGKLFEALKELGILEDRAAANYAAAGRTDRGVHALAQVVSFDTSNTDVTPRMINSMLPDDIWMYAVAKPDSDFDARRDAVSREYRYFMTSEAELDISGMRDAAELFIGVHDFSNFAYRSETDSPIREIKRIAIGTKEGRPLVVIIDIEANGFLRKMARKIVAALSIVGSGMRDRSWIESLLDLRLTEGIMPAPAFGLILKNVSYPATKFEVDVYALRRLEARLKADLYFHAIQTAVLEEMIGCISQ